ncbi:MAG TPA: ATP-binding protein [Acidimicrobiales bacterium]|nr:ATP-binding protein [Acidimicrobiales bacterium]
MTPERRIGPLALRLSAAFLTVAVAAVAVLAALIVAAAGSGTSALLGRQHRDAAGATATAAAAAFRDAGGWNGSDLAAAQAVAASAQARLVVTDESGHVVPVPSDAMAQMMAGMPGMAAADEPRGDPVTAAVAVDGRTVGTVSLTFPLSHDTPAHRLRTALWRTVVAGTALAAAVALVVAVFVARRVTRPVTALTDAAGRLAAGDRTARAGVAAPGELGELATAFDSMAARLETEDRLRRQLVTDVAHELRTPLTILRGETEALLDGVNVPDAAALESLHDEVTRLCRLVEDLETLAAADAAGLTLHAGPVDLADVAARATAAVRAGAADAGLTLAEELAPAPGAGDADRLQQVALNLLSNAVKFTPAGGTVTVRTATAGGRPFLEVADTGPGLPGDEAAQVFDRFWQGGAGRAAGGSGIGLAVAKGIVDAHGGTLAARDTGSGAVFRLELPAG